VSWCAARARRCERLTDPYQRAYYAGIISERLAHAQLTSGAMHAEAMAFTTLRSAMESFEKAEQLRQPATTTRSCAGTPVSATLAGMRRQEVADEQYEPSFGE
jgi:hypothetical protein